jgi:hypothetical protein
MEATEKTTIQHLVEENPQEKKAMNRLKMFRKDLSNFTMFC